MKKLTRISTVIGAGLALALASGSTMAASTGKIVSAQSSYGVLSHVIPAGRIIRIRTNNTFSFFSSGDNWCQGWEATCDGGHPIRFRIYDENGGLIKTFTGSQLGTQIAAIKTQRIRVVLDDSYYGDNRGKVSYQITDYDPNGPITR